MAVSFLIELRWKTCSVALAFPHLLAVTACVGLQPFSSRVVVVASLAYLFGSINLDDLHYNNRAYSRMPAYGEALVLHVTPSCNWTPALAGTSMTLLRPDLA